jgi:hypothetical protein
MIGDPHDQATLAAHKPRNFRHSPDPSDWPA